MMSYCVANISSETVQLGIFQEPALCRNIQTTTYCMAIATTAVATTLIGIKAWRVVLAPSSASFWSV